QVEQVDQLGETVPSLDLVGQLGPVELPGDLVYLLAPELQLAAHGDEPVGELVLLGVQFLHLRVLCVKRIIEGPKGPRQPGHEHGPSDDARQSYPLPARSNALIELRKTCCLTSQRQ